jgi:hypothetical protein
MGVIGADGEELLLLVWFLSISKSSSPIGLPPLLNEAAKDWVTAPATTAIIDRSLPISLMSQLLKVFIRSVTREAWSALAARSVS